MTVDTDEENLKYLASCLAFERALVAEQRAEITRLRLRLMDIAEESETATLARIRAIEAPALAEAQRKASHYRGLLRALRAAMPTEEEMRHIIACADVAGAALGRPSGPPECASVTWRWWCRMDKYMRDAQSGPWLGDEEDAG